MFNTVDEIVKKLSLGNSSSVLSRVRLASERAESVLSHYIRTETFKQQSQSEVFFIDNPLEVDGGVPLALKNGWVSNVSLSKSDNGVDFSVAATEFRVSPDKGVVTLKTRYPYISVNYTSGFATDPDGKYTGAPEPLTIEFLALVDRIHREMCEDDPKKRYNPTFGISASVERYIRFFPWAVYPL